jgi:hypothetical protein
MTASASTTASSTPTTHGNSPVRLIGLLVAIVGALMLVAGATTWGVVQSQLAAEKITVSEDAARFAGQDVNGPLTAYAEAEVIEKHALEASKGKTYAELDREDPVRAMVMNGSFLRASLFTSVLAFGVSAMAMGLGVLQILIGLALRRVASQRA